MSVFLEQVYAVLRPQKALTVAEITKAIKYERTPRDVSLALLELNKGGRAKAVQVNEQSVIYFAWQRGTPQTVSTPA